jgi:hypothetical protein
MEEDDDNDDDDKERRLKQLEDLKIKIVKNEPLAAVL